MSIRDNLKAMQTVHYDDENDIIKLKSNSEWKDWTSPGFKKIDLIALLKSEWTTAVEGYASIRSFSTQNFSLGVSSTAQSAIGYGYARTKQAFPMTGKTKLKIVGKGLLRNSSSCSGGIYLINESTGDKIEIKTYTDDGYGFTINEQVSLPTLNGNYYIEVGIQAIALYTTPYFNFDTFEIS